MARVKRGVTARRRHKKTLEQAKGYYGARRKVYRVAKQAVTKAGQYAYIGRKQKKRQFRALWITRINAAARQYGLSYSRLIDGLNKAGVSIDRKILADIAVHDIKAFGALAEKAGAALGASIDKPVEPKQAAADDKAGTGKGQAAGKAASKADTGKSGAHASADAPKAKSKSDDLTRIEGIGPKIAEVLQASGIHSYAELAKADVDHLRSVLHDAGPHFASHDPETWPQQSALAAQGKFDELKALQEQLDGGRPA